MNDDLTDLLGWRLNMLKTQEPKYAVNNIGRIVNRSSGEIIPDDEPVMIFRARDKNAAFVISYYAKICADEKHQAAVKSRLHDFVDFAHQNPEKMKEPDTDTGTDVPNRANAFDFLN
ncbi:MAG: hypothetical protein Q8N96_01545 [Methylovulum sp.]|nr:hypothetical protein [Methylovulum sp.]